MRRVLLVVFLLVFGTSAMAAQAAGPPAERRVALVIGNGLYRAVPALNNPVGDAKAVAAQLQKAGFTTVSLGLDLDRSELVRRLQEFQVIADTADWAVVYYAGHGVQVDGANYVVPVDATLRSDRDVDDEAVTLDRILLAISGARQIRLVILDACRDNPFQPRMAQAAVRFSAGRGLARVEPGAATMVAYAARDGQVARDGDEHSPFVEALLRRMLTPGLEIGQLFRRVRDDVLAGTGGQQEPYVYGSLPGRDFYFVPAPAADATAVAAPDVAKLASTPEPPAPPRRFPAVLAEAARREGNAVELARVLSSDALDAVARRQTVKLAFGARRASSELAFALSPDGLPPPGFALDPADRRDILAQLDRSGCRTQAGLTPRTLASLRGFSACTGRVVMAEPASAADLAFMRRLKSGACRRVCEPPVQARPRDSAGCGGAGTPDCRVAARRAKPPKPAAPDWIDDAAAEVVAPAAPSDWTPAVGSDAGRGGGSPTGSPSGGGQGGGAGGKGGGKGQR